VFSDVIIRNFHRISSEQTTAVERTVVYSDWDVHGQLAGV